MSKMFSFVFLCIVAGYFNSCHAITDEEKVVFQAKVLPAIAECSKEHGVSQAEIDAAKDTKNVDPIESCWFGCVLKKIEIINPDGLYNIEEALNKLQRLVHDPTELATYQDVAKKCGSVNDQAESGGEAGCERGKLFVKCIISNNVRIPLY